MTIELSESVNGHALLCACARCLGACQEADAAEYLAARHARTLRKRKKAQEKAAFYSRLTRMARGIDE